jgi:Ran GTPase-activating protein (RanGAP) involved in mRNA processing and transport
VLTRLQLHTSDDVELSRDLPAHAVCCLTNLQTLSCSNSRLSQAASATLLSQALVSMPQLRLLRLAGALLPLAGRQALAAALLQITKLTSLQLPGAWLECRGHVQPGGQDGAGDRAARDEPRCLLAHALPSVPSLEVLDLSDCALGSAGARALAHALAQLPRLSELVLARNFISDSAAVLLAQALGALQALSLVDL